MNINELIADLRARVNPQYYDQIGTESYERHQVVKALNIAVIHTLSIRHGIAVSDAAEAASILAAEVRLLRDEVNGLTGSLDRAEKALKEAQQQEPIKYLYRVIDCFGHDVLRDDPRDATIIETIPLYARPVPANLVESHQIKRDSNSVEFDGIKTAPAVAVPDATCKQCLHVDRELREVIAGLVAIAEKKGKRQGSPNHCHQRPGIWDDDNGDLAGKPCSECAIYDRARALLQSTGDKK